MNEGITWLNAIRSFKETVGLSMGESGDIPPTLFVEREGKLIAIVVCA